MSVKIASVSQESKCYKKGIRPGDMLLTSDCNEIKDKLLELSESMK